MNQDFLGRLRAFVDHDVRFLIVIVGAVVARHWPRQSLGDEA